jgi:hypothetical protein
MRLSGWFLLSSLVPSCGGTSNSDATAEPCTPGASVACACTDGRTGAQTCQSDHTLSACSCTGSSGAGGTDTEAGAAGGASGVAQDGATSGDVAAPTDGPAGDHCFGKEVVAAGSAGLFIDFENHTTAVLPNDGRHGAWGFYGDVSCTLPPKPWSPVPPAAGVAVNDTSKYAAHATASGCSSGGFFVNTAFNTHQDPGGYFDCAYDASAYDGAYFWGLGDGVRLWVSVALRTTLPLRLGGDGTCATDGQEAGCWDHYGAPFTLTADWKLYSFKWSDLAQQGFGTPTPFASSLTAELQFNVSYDQTTPTPASFWLDNIGFYKGTPPTTPP